MSDHMFRNKFLDLLTSDNDVALAIIRDDTEIDETKVLERRHERYEVITVRDKRRGMIARIPMP